MFFTVDGPRDIIRPSVIIRPNIIIRPIVIIRPRVMATGFVSSYFWMVRPALIGRPPPRARPRHRCSSHRMMRARSARPRSRRLPAIPWPSVRLRLGAHRRLPGLRPGFYRLVLVPVAESTLPGFSRPNWTAEPGRLRPVFRPLSHGRPVPKLVAGRLRYAPFLESLRLSCVVGPPLGFVSAPRHALAQRVPVRPGWPRPAVGRNCPGQILVDCRFPLPQNPRRTHPPG